MVVTALLQVSNQLRVREGVRIDGLQLTVRFNRGGFPLPLPIAKLLAPELLWEYLFSSLEALGNFRLRCRQYLPVTESIYVAHLKAINQQSVEPGEVVGPFLVCRRMHLLPIARHWAGEVGRVLYPGPWPGWHKTELLRCT